MAYTDGQSVSNLTAAAANSYEGFTAQSFDNVEITGSGIVIDVYYTRNQHTLIFKPDNGDADIVTENVYYGAAISAPDDPTKTGYTFNGWDKDIPATMPAYSVTATAQWELNQYTISYELDGGTNSESNPASYTVEDGSFTFAVPEREGYTFGGWYTSSSFTTSSKFTGVAAGSTGDLTLYAKWEQDKVKITYSVVNAEYQLSNADSLPQGYTPSTTANTSLKNGVMEDGSYFLHWCTDPTDPYGTRISYIPAGSTTPYTLYAVAIGTEIDSLEKLQNLQTMVNHSKNNNTGKGMTFTLTLGPCASRRLDSNCQHKLF